MIDDDELLELKVAEHGKLSSSGRRNSRKRGKKIRGKKKKKKKERKEVNKKRKSR